MMGHLLLNWFTAWTPPVIYAMIAVFVPYTLAKEMGILPLISRVGRGAWRRVKPRLYW